MEPFQPRLPIPTLIPENHDMIVIDLKDCFFAIPLHPDDKEKFAFSLLIIISLYRDINGNTYLKA